MKGKNIAKLNFLYKNIQKLKKVEKERTKIRGNYFLKVFPA